MKVFQPLPGSGLPCCRPRSCPSDKHRTIQRLAPMMNPTTLRCSRAPDPSVVNITNARLVRSFYSLNPQQVPQGTGTGFIWDTEGHIVTNYHVVQQADRVLVDLAGRHNL